MAQDIYARVITRDGGNQFEIPVVVLDMLGAASPSQLAFDVPEGGEFIYMRRREPTEKELEVKEQQR